MNHSVWKWFLLNLIIFCLFVPSTASSLTITENYTPADYNGHLWYDVRFDVQVGAGELPVSAFAVAYKTPIMDVWINNVAPSGMIIPSGWLSTGFNNEGTGWTHWGEGTTYTNSALQAIKGELGLLSTDYITAAAYCNYSGSSLVESNTYSGFMTIVKPASFYVAVLDNGTVLKGETVLTGGSPPVPIPAAVWLFGTGLLGLFGVRRKLRK